MERFNLRNLNDVEVKDDSVDISSSYESILENMNCVSTQSQGYCELKQHKPRFDEGCSKLWDQKNQAKLQLFKNTN
jgi:hypothetical protein